MEGLLMEKVRHFAIYVFGDDMLFSHYVLKILERQLLLVQSTLKSEAG
jgi:hypothetical protein